jgi:TetR/AcrR family transcriptional regulator, ethionamide resistance regulator
MATQRAFTVQARAGQRRRAATQEELLEATKRLLAEGAPLATLSVEKIVAEAGVVRTTFYLHFRDKYELIERLAAEQEAWIETAGQRTSADPDLSRETVRRAIDEIVAGWAKNHATLAAIIELAEYDPRMRETWRNIMHSVAGVAHDVFQGHWNLAGGAPAHPAMVAEVLSWMIERSCHQIIRDPAQVEAVSDSLAEVIWRVLHTPADAA